MAVAPQTEPRTEVVAGIATTGRPAVLRETLKYLASLADVPDRVIVCTAGIEDFDGPLAEALPFSLLVVEVERGTCRQRNAMLDMIHGEEILLFIDDDFMPSEGYFDAVRRLFDSRSDVVGATGNVLADGISGPGMNHDEGRAILNGMPTPDGAQVISEVYNAYGCNFAVRTSTVHAHGIRFDTSLPRYGWLEDVDFSRNLAQHGKFVRDSHMRGVHLGTKFGRARGVPLGYSQIANPLYLIRKGTMSRPRALRMIGRNLLANMVKSFQPEPWVDRRGRLRGNFVALRDVVTGRACPERILML